MPHLASEILGLQFIAESKSKPRLDRLAERVHTSNSVRGGRGGGCEEGPDVAQQRQVPLLIRNKYKCINELE